MDLDPTRLRVMKLIQQRRTDLKKASLAIGRNAAYLQQYLYRGIPKTLPEDAREALAIFLGVPEESLRPPKTESAAEPALPAMAAAIATAAPTAMGGGMPGFSQVPELDVRASAGHGAFHEGDEEIKAVWMFPDAVIRHELRARSANLRIITIDGDSMEPLLASGDRVLVDTAQRVPAPPGTFDEATAYCRWAGKRLPTDAEWLEAAHTERRASPSGAVPDWHDLSLSHWGASDRGELPA